MFLLHWFLCPLARVSFRSVLLYSGFVSRLFWSCWLLHFVIPGFSCLMCGPCSGLCSLYCGIVSQSVSSLQSFLSFGACFTIQNLLCTEWIVFSRLNSSLWRILWFHPCCLLVFPPQWFSLPLLRLVPFSESFYLCFYLSSLHLVVFLFFIIVVYKWWFQQSY